LVLCQIKETPGSSSKEILLFFAQGCSGCSIKQGESSKRKRDSQRAVSSKGGSVSVAKRKT